MSLCVLNSILRLLSQKSCSHKVTHGGGPLLAASSHSHTEVCLHQELSHMVCHVDTYLISQGDGSDRHAVSSDHLVQLFQAHAVADESIGFHQERAEATVHIETRNILSASGFFFFFFIKCYVVISNFISTERSLVFLFFYSIIQV
jgi:hypothetical protein